MAKSDKKDDVQFLGVAIEDLLTHTEAELKAGQFHDGTKIKPQVREVMTAFTSSLRAAKGKRRYYVFVWSKFIFIKGDF